jgi:nicotinate-nucleotide pyrophosphorylase (carboxylating)
MSPETLAALADADLDADLVEALARAAVEEDLAGGVDVTSVATVPEGLTGTAVFASRADGVVAGVGVAMAVLDVVGEVEHLSRVPDGTRCAAPCARC